MSATASPARILHLVLGCALLQPGCDAKPPSDPVDVIPADARIEIHEGNNQIGPANSSLPVPLSVRVTDARGRPLEGTKIRWAVSLSGGSVSGVNGSLTDERGIASARRTLAGVAGRHTTSATIEATGAAVAFTTVTQVQGATRMSLPPGGALVLPGDSVLAALPAPVRILVQDQDERPVPGVIVTWSATGGAVSSDATRTDSGGVAEVGFTRGPLVGQHVVRASVPGLGGSPTSFTTTTVAGRPAALEKLGGDEQAGTVLTELASPFVVHVSDAHGNSVAGAPVSWLFEAETGPAVIAQTMTAVNLPGEPRPVAFYIHQLGDDPGAHVITAAVADRPEIASVSFTFTAAPAPPIAVGVFDWDYWYYYCWDGCGFAPQTTMAKPGETVVWTWHGSQQHNVVFEDDPTAPVSSALKTTGSHVRTFHTPGAYRYRCTAHSTSFAEGMVGTVLVSGPPSTATRLEKVSGDGQHGAIYGTLENPFVVRVADAEDNSVAGVSVSWYAESDDGPTVVAHGITAFGTVGELLPVAAYTHVLGGEAGTHAITVAVDGRPDIVPVSFTFTAETLPDAAVSVHDWDDYQCWYLYWECGFRPSLVRVSQGKTVTWTWRGSQDHNVVFEDDPTIPVSSPIQTTGVHTRTFNTPGTYRYRCTLHSTSFTEGMVGAVVVL